MAKRSRNDDEDETALQYRRNVKRSKSSTIDRLSRLSDELLLKVLSFLPIKQLTVCQRLSRKYRRLAGDGQLWKSHYYDRFVRPRASRLPGRKELGSPSGSLNFASKSSRWLEEEHLVKDGRRTDWKKQYKLRHNWTSGSCAVNEIPVAEDSSTPPILVEMHDGIIFSADHSNGIRAWLAQGSREMVAQISCSSSTPPTSLAVDVSCRGHNIQTIIVGFEDGSFNVCRLDKRNRSFVQQYSHQPSVNGSISSIALSWPYALTMTATQLLSLYRFDGLAGDYLLDVALDPPLLLHSLKSHSICQPLSTILRVSKASIIICVAFALPSYLSGWTVGIQEIQVSPDGTLQRSRLASAIDNHYRPLAFSNIPVVRHLALLKPINGASTAVELRQFFSKPTSLSYNHPYLLISRPDNTLTLYIVTSTPDALCISSGDRLFGHTSSVSGAQVCHRGKAVSVSRRGEELRIWELEGGFGSAAGRKRLASGDLSVPIQAEKAGLSSSSVRQPGGHLTCKTRSDTSMEERQSVDEDQPQEPAEPTLMRGWVGFDEENVVVLKEHQRGRQALVVYDFT